MTEQEAVENARSYFLTGDNVYGCAETAFLVLKGAFGLPDAIDSSVAMGLNGGIAYSGSVCGAVTGAALAVGMLAGRRIPQHKDAKRAARRIIMRCMVAFQAEYGSLNCRDLIGLDIRDEERHRAFIDSGIWRDRCMRQIEFAVCQLIPLRDERIWDQTLREWDAPDWT